MKRWNKASGSHKTGSLKHWKFGNVGSHLSYQQQESRAPALTQVESVCSESPSSPCSVQESNNPAITQAPNSVRQNDPLGQFPQLSDIYQSLPIKYSFAMIPPKQEAVFLFRIIPKALSSENYTALVRPLWEKYCYTNLCLIIELLESTETTEGKKKKSSIREFSVLVKDLKQKTFFSVKDLKMIAI